MNGKIFWLFFVCSISVLIFSTQALAANKYLLFIPGYYGTTFYDKETGKKVWIKGTQTLRIIDNDTTLALPIPGVSVPEALDLKIGEILDEVNVLGYEYMAYGETQNYLRGIAAKEGFQYEAVTYDWRKDPMEGILALDRKINALRKSPEDEFYVVAHSLGAAIVSYYVRYGAVPYEQATENWAGLKNFKKIVLVAAPFKGTMLAFNTMFTGLSRGLNRDLLSARTFSTLESSYFMLPPKGYDLTFDHNLQQVSLDLYNPDSWVKNRWGVFNERNGFKKQSTQARYNFVAKMLQRSQMFSYLINAPVHTPFEKVPTLYIKGYGLETPDKGVWIEPYKRPNQFIFGLAALRKRLPQIRFGTNIFKVDGDGSLPSYSTEPIAMIEAMGAQVIKNPMEHLEILHAKSTKSQVQQFFE